VPLYLDKILSQLVYPLGTSLLLIAIALIGLLLGRSRLASSAIVLAATWLGLWSLPVVSDQLRLSLESRYPQVSAEQLPSADVIILLGGGMQATPPDWPYPGLGSSADRVWHAARLYHAGKAPVILVSGGVMGWEGQRRSGAHAMREFLVDLGVPTEAVLIEDRSRSTRENAVFSLEILRQQRFETALLVTSALHMHRSIASFRALGLNPVPAATDFEVMPEPNHIKRWLPDAEALHDSTRALHEYIGLVTYRLRGWAD
jgi:uncharacterized SAM-binding protein YcdF (DUF218 family)